MIRVSVRENSFHEIARRLTPELEQVVDDTIKAVASGTRRRGRERAIPLRYTPREHLRSRLSRGFRLAWWWRFAEYGTAVRPADPALHPAIEEQRTPFQLRIVRAFTRAR